MATRQSAYREHSCLPLCRFPVIDGSNDPQALITFLPDGTSAMTLFRMQELTIAFV